MPFITVIFGGLLIIIGIAGYLYGMMNDKASITAMIPAFFGIVLTGLGVAAGGMESLRKHLMHVAVVIGLLGFILPLGRLLPNITGLTMSAAVISQIAMSVVCLVFVILAVRSFIAARANR